MSLRFSLGVPAVAVFSLVVYAVPPPASGPTFTVKEADLPPTPMFVVYGDNRFTHFPFPRNATSPWARQALVAKIASEKPDALFISGDIPFQGAQMSDYKVFEQETRIWAAEHLRIYPALGNHEFYTRSYIANQERGLANWWSAFPQLKGLRWYSIALGRRVYAIVLDSNFGALNAGTPQRQWLDQQFTGLPDLTDFVFILLHHVPLTEYMEDHAAPPDNSMKGSDLDSFLERKQQQLRAHLVVFAGHVHNYGRFERNGVAYVISGGGGAHPVFFRREPDDLFKGKDMVRNGEPLPNYNYVKLELRSDRLDATMIRITNPLSHGEMAAWENGEKFSIQTPRR